MLTKKKKFAEGDNGDITAPLRGYVEHSGESILFPLRQQHSLVSINAE